jgi:predicted transcriptional regulator
MGRTVRSCGIGNDMHIETPEQQLESVRRGIAEIDAGHCFPHDAMKVWLLSLSLDRALPPPKCACGESHDEPA